MFPKANIKQYTPGTTRNLEIKYNGTTVYDKKGGDGNLTGPKAVEVCQKVQRAI